MHGEPFDYQREPAIVEFEEVVAEKEDKTAVRYVSFGEPAQITTEEHVSNVQQQSLLPRICNAPTMIHCIWFIAYVTCLVLSSVYQDHGSGSGPCTDQDAFDQFTLCVSVYMCLITGGLMVSTIWRGCTGVKGVQNTALRGGKNKHALIHASKVDEASKGVLKHFVAVLWEQEGKSEDSGDSGCMVATDNIPTRKYVELFQQLVARVNSNPSQHSPFHPQHFNHDIRCANTLFINVIDGLTLFTVIMFTYIAAVNAASISRAATGCKPGIIVGLVTLCLMYVYAAWRFVSRAGYAWRNNWRSQPSAYKSSGCQRWWRDCCGWCLRK